MTSSIRFNSIRILLALLLGLCLVLGAHAGSALAHNDMAEVNPACEVEAWPVRISSDQKK